MNAEPGPDALKILVVDDEPFMRSTIKAVLRAIGRFLVEQADDGEAALEAVARFKPDLVLCDVRMPRMDGLQFVERLRARPDASLRDTPVVMLTADAEQGTILDAARLNVDGYLLKPVSPKRLGDHLQAVLRHHQSASSGLRPETRQEVPPPGPPPKA